MGSWDVPILFLYTRRPAQTRGTPTNALPKPSCQILYGNKVEITKTSANRLTIDHLTHFRCCLNRNNQGSRNGHCGPPFCQHGRTGRYRFCLRPGTDFFGQRTRSVEDLQKCKRYHECKLDAVGLTDDIGSIHSDSEEDQEERQKEGREEECLVDYSYEEWEATTEETEESSTYST